MKICFVLQRNFAYIGHAMALALKSRYGVTDFCGYVVYRSTRNFLTSQTDIPYTHLLLNEEVHERYKSEKLDFDYLRALQDEYGIPNLSPYIDIDRIVRYNQFVREYPYDTPPYTYEEMLRQLQVKAKAVLKFFNEEKPDVIISSVIGDTITMLLHTIAKKRGVPFLLIQECKVGENYTMTEAFGDLSFTQETFKKLQNGTLLLSEERERAKRFLDNFRKKPEPHSFIETPSTKPINRKRQFRFLLPLSFITSFIWAVRMCFDYLRNPHKEDYDLIRPQYYFIDHIKRKLRVLYGFDDLYDTPGENEKYAFYPLQYEPEMTLLLFAPFYTDQLWVIKQVAKSLPVDHLLYVKEHPSMFGYRTRRYYKELKKIPNVRLISPSVTGFDLMRKSKLVVTISGTGGWEALAFEKPVIIFSEIFYGSLPMVRRCRSIEDLPNIVKEHLATFKHDEEALINMTTALYAESAELPLVQIWVLDGSSNFEKKKEGVIPFVDYVAKKLKLTPIV